jgi:hypothetical protein
MRALERTGIRFNKSNSAIFSINEIQERPNQWITNTRELSVSLSDETNRTSPNWMNIVLGRRPEHLCDFSPDALNEFNARYYESQGAFRDLPDIYVRDCVVAKAFASHLDRSFPTGLVRIKEVCAGEGSLQRWNHFFDLASQERPIEFFLADLSFAEKRSEFKTNSKYARALTEKLDMLAPIPQLSNEERINCIIACYGFDSVWFPEDRFVIKHNNSWFESLYRVGIPDLHPNTGDLRAAFEFKSAVALSARHFEGLVIERAVRSLGDSDGCFMRKFILDRLANTTHGSVCVPAGLVKWVTEAFERQLAVNGKLIIADIGIFDSSATLSREFLETGCSAQGRPIDFHLAKMGLEAAGFKVTVERLDRFVERALGPDWRNAASSVDVKDVSHPDQYIMDITKS